jgi:hypothetical protein
MFTYGEDVLQSDATYATVPLWTYKWYGGFIALSDGEVIKIRLQSLNAADVVRINGIEEPLARVMIFMNAKLWLDILNQDFDVTGYDLVALTKMLLSTKLLLLSIMARMQVSRLWIEITRSIDSVTAISVAGVLLHRTYWPLSIA